jgi:hypothetical protein
VSYVVLGLSFIIEGASLLNGIKQVHGKAERWRVRPVSYLRHTSDTSVRAVVFEDVSALIGLVLAAVGLALTELTGSGVWDGLSSVAIGLLLLVVVAAKVDFRDAVSSGDIEEACGRAEQHLTARFPEIGYVFLDPTSALEGRPPPGLR